MYSSSLSLNSSKLSKPRPRKNSSLICPKIYSVAPLSMQLPFLDMLWTMAAFSSTLQ